MTVAEYMHSLEATTDNLPILLGKWSDLDDDLAEEYTSQVWWMLSRVVEVYNTYPDCQARIMARVLDLNIIFEDHNVDWILTPQEWEEILVTFK